MNTAPAPALDRIPLIDFAAFVQGNASAKQAAAREIAQACETIGFLYVKNHGVPQAKIDAVFEAARFFFHLPEAVRMDDAIRSDAKRTRGYMPIGARQYEGTAAPDLMHAFKIQEELPPDDPDILAGNRMHQRNRWPVGYPEFRATLLDYFAEMTALSQRLLRAFGLALDLPEDYFLQFYRKPMTQLSILHYPPQEPKAALDEYGIRPHADATAFTIVCQDEIGGLQVKGVGDAWIPATPIPGTFVINIGDMMARWTNDRFCSTKHRVYNRQGRERYSVPFFGIPDFDAVVECLSTCQGPGNPAKYPPLPVGESILRKFSSDWSKKG